MQYLTWNDVTHLSTGVALDGPLTQFSDLILCVQVNSKKQAVSHGMELGGLWIVWIVFRTCLIGVWGVYGEPCISQVKPKASITAKGPLCSLNRKRVDRVMHGGRFIFILFFFIYADDRMFSPFIKRPTPWMHTLGFVVVPDLSRHRRQ